jgi:RHS repeat-associated protein
LSWQVEYDPQDRTAAIIDPAGRTTRFGYEDDGQGRLRQAVRTSPDGAAVTRDLDEGGRLVAMRDSAGTVAYGYDDLGRLNRVAREGTPTIAYTHDTLDRIKTLQVGDFYRVEYHYDFLGRLELIDTPAGSVRYEHRTGEGTVLRQLPNGPATLWQYAPDGALEKITHLMPADPEGTRHSILGEYSYTYRPDGLIGTVAERSDAGETQRNYQYDTVGHLVRAKGAPRPQYVYGYDLVGNRTQTLSTLQAKRNFGYDWAGRLNDIDGTTTVHDAAGNLTALTLGGKTWHYRFDSEDRLAESAGGKVSYRYDGDGNLIERRLGETRLTFIPDPLAKEWRPLVMEGASGERTLVIWDGTTPLMLIRQGRPEWLLHDHLGSVRLVVDGRGKIARRIDYEPFGVMEDAADAQDFAPRFAGLFWDPAGEVYLTRARAYSPMLGRFLQIDSQHRVPMGDQEGLGLYAYCASDPLNYIDPEGAERTPAELHAEINHRAAVMRDKQRAMLEAMRFQQMDMALKQRELMERMREQARHVAERQLRGAEQLRDDFFFIYPRTIGVTAANVSTMVLAPFGGLGPALFNGFLGGNAERWREEIATRDAGVAGILSAQTSAADRTAGLIGYARMGRDIGVALSHASTQAYRVVRKGDVLTSDFDLVDRNQYTFIAQQDRFAHRWSLPWDELSGIAVDKFEEAIGERIGRGIGKATRPGVNWFTEWPGQLLNFVGKQSNWIGANRSGGAFAEPRQKDALGRLPLGDTTIPATGKAGPKDRNIRWDEAAKWHDVQDYVNWHAPIGTEVKVPWGNGEFRYFISRGQASKKHDAEVGLLALNLRSFPMTHAPTTAHPQDLAAIKAKYPVPGTHPVPLPTQVGGVYLGSTGQALTGLGQLEGIALDDNNNLVLLDQGGQKIDLPPLRLDDLVTVFRSVYLHGEAPSVSIDPNPEDPEGSAMSIRHGTATAATYVGWVLFQADRLMKGYTLGADNDTAKDIKTTVPGYDQVRNTLFFGGGMPKKGQTGGHWERFWIVPAQTNRFSGDRLALTLFDVPLKVKTQSMKWEAGKLVDDTSGKSSPGATAFTDWFTQHYDAIAGERLLLPPPESGLTKPVPVFTELRRIALMTAIAEKLRDQGVPLPFWMRDYQVTPVPFERFTPALEVTRSKGQVVARVFGGVNLAAEDKAVRNYDPSTDLAALSAPDRERTRKDLARATALGGAVRDELRSAEPLAVKKLDKMAGAPSAVALPGAQTQALAPARLDEADLSLPIAGGQAIRLVRSYNSFFNPQGPWGKGWALDLPRLEEGRVPVQREGDVTSFQTVYEAVTPLNSNYERFSRIEPVLALDNSRLLVSDSAQASEFHGLADAEPEFLSGPTKKLLRKDGGAWHFDQAGNLVATEAGGVRVIYERDAKGRPTRILGLLGRQPVASIALAYDAAGLLESASAKREGDAAPASTVRYGYDASGRLVTVTTDAGRLGYRYQGSWVTAVTFAHAPLAGDPDQDPSLRTFEYDPRGRLLREVAADGTATDYRIASTADGQTLSATPGGGAAPAETMRYDAALRPVAARFADGSGANWHYPEHGGTVLDLQDAAGAALVRVEESGDRRQRRLDLPGGVRIASEHDGAGRLTSLAQNGHAVLEQNWAPDGRLRTAKTESQAEHYEYDADGLVTRVIQTPPGVGERFDTWQATRFDPFGRPLEVKDSSGLDLALAYDQSGRLQQTVSRQGDQTYGVELIRDGAGRIAGLVSPQGRQSYRYDANGLPLSLTEERGGATAVTEWDSGLLRRVRQFDGGTTTLAYYDDEARGGLLKTILAPNDLALNYGYDDEDRLTAVDVGGRSRLVMDYDGQGRLTGWRHQAAGSSPPGH